MRAPLRWYLWTCLTFVVIGVAAMFGLFGLLLRNDLTYLGFAIIALYIVCSACIGWQVVKRKPGYAFTWFLAEMMERAGILGSFIGLAAAFQALSDMGAGNDWKQALIHGVMTKFYCSIVGLVASMMLKVQIKILDAEHEG